MKSVDGLKFIMSYRLQRAVFSDFYDKLDAVKL